MVPFATTISMQEPGVGPVVTYEGGIRAQLYAGATPSKMTSGRPLQAAPWLHSLYLPLLEVVHTPTPCVFPNISTKAGVAARTQIRGIENPARHAGQNLLWRCFFPGIKSGLQAGIGGLPWNRHKPLSAPPQQVSSLFDLVVRFLSAMGAPPSMTSRFPRGDVRAQLASFQEFGARAHLSLASTRSSSTNCGRAHFPFWRRALFRPRSRSPPNETLTFGAQSFFPRYNRAQPDK